MPAVSAIRARAAMGAFSTKQSFHALADLVPDRTHPLNWLPLRIWYSPINSLQSRNVGAGFAATRFAATHCYEHGGAAGKLVSEFLRFRRTEVNADLAHDLHNFRMHVNGRLRPRRDCNAGFMICVNIEQRCSHLGSTRIVHAREEVSLDRSRLLMGHDRLSLLWRGRRCFFRRDHFRPDNYCRVHGGLNCHMQARTRLSLI